MKLWGGRFEKATSHMVDDFHSSITFDSRLYKQDILGSIAHATMLGEQGIIPNADADAIVCGLKGILADIEAGNVTFSIEAEDIHMNIEMLLTQRIGDAGKRLHTGRSRNDQVALDARMYVKDAVSDAITHLASLEKVLLERAKQEASTVMAGYTHLQKAQPITLGHHLMAYFEMFRRDIDRFSDSVKRVDEMPLGSGALAGTTYPLDRPRVAQLLGFAEITRNSLDAVSDRDFMIEYCANASLVMMHLSRFCEELILWSSHEFGYVEMDDAFSTGSSIMPQKKNPDVAELVRGKTGRVYGDLSALLAMMKSLPLAYNKDMQEDKEALFDAHDTLVKSLSTFTGMLQTLTFKRERMLAGALGGFANATDAADYLVKKGLPFREAHEVIGKLVHYCIEKRLTLLDVALHDYKHFCPLFTEDIFDAISLETCVSQRCLPGGPAPAQVLSAVSHGEAWLNALQVL